MDLSTTYMGIELRNPLVHSASPLAEDLDNIRRMEDEGVAAIVMHSLFEEQLRQETRELYYHLTHGTESYAESLSYFPEPEAYSLGPEEYLEHIQAAKSVVSIPIIGSLNGHSAGGWTDYAKRIEQAGADALELNIYFLPTHPGVTGAEIEDTHLEILKSVKTSVSIPVAVKVSPFFSAMANMAKKMDDAGADGLVLFNRFYQPDIDLENLEVIPNVLLSTPQAMRLPLRWIAILYGHVKASLAATSGIHTAQDVLKMLMAGASVTMLCSVLLMSGIGTIKTVLEDMRVWMEKNEYDSIHLMQGSMSHRRCENPSAFERANYMRALTQYR
ncbi:MAG: dihydroorotate dehydrogenase-like protein [Candidatus Latescibacteria bacterium]|nr:dihydroorotate dehydrogenase-like protein [Candidatus Latescibacterota bacterium]NIM21991.1 dihydroorotate dehydrogenase-like protein [Candidatus Latescibacterota bacterium]NIM66009.1 dihydroorotate dehydrogenase-like protein [Candidatus Latescibacterota bacterium]NIO02417.1 dihydroorotate dehydrogenase-like protein [Candidatus Latescibacterota bacterium]NIO29328.1 dihydroorotate dehydrogenase-like protein [Candidatus Latescibacterota bacterium]